MNMKKKILIIGLIALSLFVSNILVKEVFIANTPKIYKNLGQRLTGKFNSFIASLNPFVMKPSSVESNNQPVVTKSIHDVNKMADDTKDLSAFQAITKGVYGKETEGVTYTVIKQNEVEWLEYIFIVDGKEFKIKMPKGQTPPTQQMIEQIYK